MDKQMLSDYEAMLERQDKRRHQEWTQRVDKVQKKMDLMADGVVRNRDQAEHELEMRILAEEREKNQRDTR